VLLLVLLLLADDPATGKRKRRLGEGLAEVDVEEF
jgi:hypothetical protein